MRWSAPETAKRPPEFRKRPLPAPMVTPAEPFRVRELKTEAPASAVASDERMELEPWSVCAPPLLDQIWKPVVFRSVTNCVPMPGTVPRA